MKRSLKTMACTGPGAMVGKPANVATADSVIVVAAGVGMEQLTDCIASRRRHPDHGSSAGLLTTIPGRRRVADARGVRRRRGPRAEPESIPARVRASDGSPQAAALAAAKSSAGRCQARVLRGRSLTSAAIRTTSSTVWTLRSVPFGK